MLIIRIRAPHISALLLIILIALNASMRSRSRTWPPTQTIGCGLLWHVHLLQDENLFRSRGRKGTGDGLCSRYGDSEVIAAFF